MLDFLPQVLQKTTSVGEARRFEEMDGSDIALCWYNARFVVVSPDMLKWWILNRIGILFGIVQPMKESDIATSLVEHICTRCEHALRMEDGRHHLLRYVPMKYEDIWNGWISWSLDGDQEILGTICALGCNPRTKIIGDEYDQCWVIYSPVESCPKDQFLD